MRKSKIKQGNLILEGMVSLFIVSLLIFCSFQVYMTSYKLKSENNLKENYINILDAVSKEIIYNKDFHFIENLKGNNRLNIPCDYVNMLSVANKDINDLFVNEAQNKLPYINVSIEDGTIYKVRLTLFYQKSGKAGEVHSDIYKGKY